MDSADYGFNHQRARPIDVAVWLLKWLVWIVCAPVWLLMWAWQRVSR